MALSYWEKTRLFKALDEYAEEHIGEQVTIQQLREATETDYATVSYTAQMGSNFVKVDKGVYEIPIKFSVDHWVKDKSVIKFCDKDNNVLFTYDFNTLAFSIKEVRLTKKTDTFIICLCKELCNLPEWIFNYPDLISDRTLRMLGKKDICPKGYIEWCRTNNKMIDTITLKEYNTHFYISLFTTEYGKSIAEYVINKNSYNHITEENKAFLEKIKKYEEKMDFAYNHEYLKDFFESATDITWGRNHTDSTTKVHEIMIEYLEMCEELGEEPIFKNFLKCYSIVKRTINLKKRSAISEDIAKNNDKRLAFENDDVIVIVPTTYEEFKTEADYQRNCVCAYYSSKVADNETNVVFIRKKSEPNIPYITCEVTKSGIIRQYLTRFNSTPSDDFSKVFFDIYKKYLNGIEF